MHLIRLNAATKTSAYLSSVHLTQLASMTVQDSPADATMVTKQAKRVFASVTQKQGDSRTTGMSLLRRLLQVLMKILIFTFPEDRRVNPISALILMESH